MNTDIKIIVENFFNKENIEKMSGKSQINYTDILYNNINIGDPLYYNVNGFSLTSNHKHDYIAKCVITADLSLYKRPVFMAKKDLVEYMFASDDAVDLDCCVLYGWTPRKEYYKFKYYTLFDAAKDMDGWGNTEEQLNHLCPSDNGQYKSGIKEPSLAQTVKHYHKQAYIGSVGEWTLIWKNIHDNKELFRGFVENGSFFWTSTMKAFDDIYRFQYESTHYGYSAALPYNRFRLRPLILI